MFSKSLTKLLKFTLQVTYLLAALSATALLHACAYSPVTDPNVTFAFTNPERVTVSGYDDDVMEPFLTRDGKYLLFNNSNDPAVNTDLHYAERLDDLHFRYLGKVGGVNTQTLEGVPTVDRNSIMYFVSPRSYEATLSTVYRGAFSKGSVSNVELVPGISRAEPGIVNFDVELSADGKTLYFVDGTFSGGQPTRALLVIAEKTGASFRRKENSEFVLRNVNSDALQYAASISANGLSLFFNRTTTGTGGGTAIFLATRRDTSSQFGIAQRLGAITGFVEGAALSSDEQSLYYHRKDGNRFVLYRVSRAVTTS